MQKSRGCGFSYNRKHHDSIQGKGMRVVPLEKEIKRVEKRIKLGVNGYKSHSDYKSDVSYLSGLLFSLNAKKSTPDVDDLFSGVTSGDCADGT